jgi:hypothetical protein
VACKQIAALPPFLLRRDGGCTLRARSSKAIGSLKKSAVVETSAVSYEEETSLELARIDATSGARASGSSAAKAS